MGAHQIEIELGAWLQPCTMTSFGWKRKRQLFGEGASVFNQEEEGNSCEEREVDWLSGAKRRRAILLEDCQAKSKRLQHEGSVLAENQRYWEAIKYWNEAIELTPRSAVLHEMKSQVNSEGDLHFAVATVSTSTWCVCVTTQVLLELGELFPAVEAAESAVRADPTWPIAWQTLARAQIGIGEVEMVRKN